MRIFLACPAPPGSRKGNRVTATRWAGLLEALGHEVVIGEEYDGAPFDLMIALHARKSHPAVQRFRRRHSNEPLIVALTGTDLYHDVRVSRQAKASLELADYLVLLQPCGRDELPAHLWWKVRVVFQSALPTLPRPKRSERFFDVCVLGHLRAEKDPFRAAFALRLLPEDSRLRVTHAGQAMSPAMAKRARALMKRDPRYRWLGEISNRQARTILARSRLLVLSSRLEGGANVVSEAIADDVPVLASHIPGNVGILGADYPGYFPTGDTRALATLLHQAETDMTFLGRLESRIAQLRPLVDPAREKAAWRDLLGELQTG
jgi:putative glycosyltransferase (TIGR04348 family)